MQQQPPSAIEARQRAIAEQMDEMRQEDETVRDITKQREIEALIHGNDAADADPASREDPNRPPTKP